MEEKMVVALRVLVCIQDHRAPDYKDLLKLKSWVGSSERNTDPDELACMVINAEIKHKREMRDLAKSSAANGNRAEG
jgi:hypothetical protein